MRGNPYVVSHDRRKTIEYALMYIVRTRRNINEGEEPYKNYGLHPY